MKEDAKATTLVEQGVRLEWLSEHRSEIMGFSIFIIVLYHFFGRGGTALIDKCCRGLFSQGYVGVDFFMLVSGLGLTYSCLKKFNLREYYIRRWVRIFPVFTFITLIECWIVRGESLELALLRSTTLGYWFGFPYIDWYIPALVGIYAIFPLIFKLVVEPRRYWLAFGIGLGAFAAGITGSYMNAMDWKHLAMVYRIPDFLLGCMVAVAIKDGYDKKIVRRYITISALVGVACFALKIGGSRFLWFTNLGLTPLYLLVLNWICNKLKKSQCGRFMVWLFSWMGLFTLEWYRISSSFERLLTNEVCPEHHLLFVLLWLVVSMALSYFTYLIFKRINDLTYRKLIGTKL